MQPDNAILSDTDTGVALPEAQPDENILVEERKMAKYSQSDEYKRLKEHFEAKIAYWQQFLPGSTSKLLIDLSREERADKWVLADEVIKELNSIMLTYEQMSEIVKNAEISSP